MTDRNKTRSRSDAVGKAKKYDADTWQAWGRLYRHGATMRAIATMYGVAPSTVMRRLHGIGVKGRPPGQPRKLSTEHASKVAGTGLTERAAANVTGVSQTTINRRLREADGRGPFPSEVARGR